MSRTSVRTTCDPWPPPNGFLLKRVSADGVTQGAVKGRKVLPGPISAGGDKLNDTEGQCINAALENSKDSGEGGSERS